MLLSETQPADLISEPLCTTLDASVLVTVLLLLGCHGMARGLPAQLRDADGGGRAQGGRADPRVADCPRSPCQLREGSMPRVDELSTTS